VKGRDGECWKSERLCGNMIGMNKVTENEMTRGTEELRLTSQDETRQLGRKLAEKAVPGTVIALTGDLGVGKTTLTKAIAEGLGVEDMITSPTFTIVKEYKGGRIPLYHFDVYRLAGDDGMADPDELYELGYEEYFFGDGVCVIEWADVIEELLPEDAVRINIAYGENEGERVVTFDCGSR